VRKLIVVNFILLLSTTLAAAQVPTSGTVFFGYSYLNTDFSSIGRTNANGWEASFEGKVFPFVGMVADFSSYYGSQSFPAVCNGIGDCIPSINANVSEQNYLFGPRVSFSAGKFRPFAEALFGAGHVNANAAGSDTSFATAIGGGLDYRIIRPIAWRFQGDYVRTSFFGTSQDTVRLSTGIVFRF
jgi:hypothetical protein